MQREQNKENASLSKGKLAIILLFFQFKRALICGGNGVHDGINLFGGAHNKDYVVVKGPSANVVKFDDESETVKGNVFVIGLNEPAIKLPEAEN